MRRVFRPLAVFAIATGVSLTAMLQMFVGGAHGQDRKNILSNVSFFAGYELSKLEVLETTLYHIEEQYVEPARVDWEKMYVKALQGVERRVPICLFTREAGSGVLSLEVAEHRTVLEVPVIEGRQQLQRELKAVAKILSEHLTADDVPAEGESEASLAQVEYAMINGLLSTLDPHSMFLPPEDGKEMDVENQGEFGGLGINIVVRDGRLTVEYPLKNTPAQRAGLQPDDHIVRIDGESTINMSLDEAVSRMRGPIGDPVVLEVIRDSFQEAKEFDIVRQTIKINPVDGELLDGGVGYVNIPAFHNHVERDLNHLLARLLRESNGRMSGLILDLRSNPGGYVTQAVAVADAFLDEGNIVSTIDGTGRKHDSHEARSHDTQPNYPLVVLVDANSASASEIVAGAFRNNERAVIIGERTFGKGSVQNLHPYYDDSKLKLTIHKYLTPGDRSIQSVGIPADIEVVPTRVDGSKEVAAAMFYRERVRREADLDKHLERSSMRNDEAPYRIRYLRSNETRRRSASLETDDYEVQLARDVLLAAAGSYRRPDVLAAAGQVVARHQRIQNQAVVQALEEVGIDWEDGPSFARDVEAPVSVRFDMGPDGSFSAGQEETFALEVTNTSEKTLYRLAAVVTENDVLEGREFIFGKLAPGESKRIEQSLQIDPGYPSERARALFSFRDAGAGELFAVEEELLVVGKDLPALGWRWEMSDAEHGNGDGKVDVGEHLELKVTVENRGEGSVGEPFVRLKNRSGKPLDILQGSMEPGVMVDDAGDACTVLEAGWEAGRVVGDPETGADRIARRAAPKYPAGCHRRLEPGESWTGVLSFKVNDRLENDPLRVELILGDNTAFDQASVLRAGFYSYFTQEEEIAFELGGLLGQSEFSEPPRIDITRSPETMVGSPRVTLSGVVTNAPGLSHVMVFAGDDKVFYQGKGQGGAVRSVPFTADVVLEPGMNTLTVLATGAQGTTRSRSVVTWYDPSSVARVELE
jgi:carboxyl-terminal processing protease